MVHTGDKVHFEENVPLAPLTSFGIGGPARYFIPVTHVDELQAALVQARERGLPVYILGGGTNVLISDRGFPGLVVRMNLTATTVDHGMVTAEAGGMLAALVDTAAEQGLSGLEFFAGIPGTVGGAVRGNAGAFGAVIGDLVRQVRVLDLGVTELKNVAPEQCRFAYRNSLFKENRDLVIIAASLELSAGSPPEIRAGMAAVLERRGAVMEHEKSVGSFFVNPIPKEEWLIRKFEQDRQVVCRNCMIPAGWFIDQAGLRGMRIGGAMISERHGNYLINTGTATAADVVQLADLVKRRVREAVGVELREEVEYVGFDQPEG